MAASTVHGSRESTEERLSQMLSRETLERIDHEVHRQEPLANSLPASRGLAVGKVRRINDKLSALTSSQSNFPFALGGLVPQIIGHNDRASSAEGRIWWREGRDLVTCILSHLVCSPHEVKPRHRLPTLWLLLIKPESAVEAKLQQIETESSSILARVLALDLLAYTTAGEFEIIRTVAVEQIRSLYGVAQPATY